MFFSDKKAFLILFAIVSFSLNGQESSLEYTIHPQEENGKIAICQSEVSGNDEGVTEILLPSSWAGQDELY